jgi:hypothetical protein
VSTATCSPSENYCFARQYGCTRVVAHLVDYFNQGEDNDRQNQPTGGRGGWGRAGIPVLGYNFSLAGVTGRIKGPFARGRAISVGMEGEDETPIPKGMVCNMIYDRDAPPGTVESATPETLWQRLKSSRSGGAGRQRSRRDHGGSSGRSTRAPASSPGLVYQARRAFTRNCLI